MKVIPLAVAAAIVFTSSVASAQWGYEVRQHSSTAAEGRARGMADVVRSAGDYNLKTSEAAKNVEQARSVYLDNRLKATQTYFEMRRVNKEYRDANKKPRPTSEQLFRLAKNATPKRMGASEVDPVTGEVLWPVALTDEAFADYRSKVDAIFADRANSQGQLGLDSYKEMQALMADLQEELKRKVRDFPPQTYTESMSFLKRLANESRF